MQRVQRVVELVSLQEVIDRPIETLSKGFKRRVALAQAMLHEPPVLILDEPTDGLDPNQKHDVRGLIRTLSKEVAIIVSTHILEEVDAICTRAVIINHGRIIADGTADDLLCRLPEHNSLLVAVDGNEAATARSVLQRFADRPVVETVDVDARVQLRLLGSAEAPPLVHVTQALHDAGVTARAISVDRGRMDDVFRLLTNGSDVHPPAKEDGRRA